jgi:uncharacterized damage-inducible protein DinB
MTLQEARTLHAFSSWATQRIFDALRKLPPELLNRDLQASHRSVLGTLGHLVGSEAGWLSALTGTPDPPELIEDIDLPSLKTVWEATGYATAAWLGTMSDRKLAGTFSAPSPEGKMYTHTYAQAFQHVVDHSTFHRGQIVALLRQLGQTPPSTGLIRFFRETGKG